MKFFTWTRRKYSGRARGVKHRERLLRARDARLSVAIRGSGPALLLLHGLTASRQTWRRALPALAEEFTVVAPDLAGRGRSPGEPGLRYRLLDEVDRLRGLLEALGLERVLAAGHSQGAALGLALAATGPEVSGLVLVNPVTPWTRRPPALALLDAVPGAGALASGLVPLLAEPATRWTLRRRVFTGAAEPSSRDVAAFARPYREPARAAVLPAILSDWNPAALEGYLPRPPLAGVLLAGARDRRIPAREALRLAARLGIPGEVVPETGHALPLERPGRLVRAVRAVGRTAGQRRGDASGGTGADHGSRQDDDITGGDPSA